MAPVNLIPLHTIEAFDETLREKLAEYWITTANEFVSTARSSNQTYGSGLAALRNVLNLDEERVRDLVQAARDVLPADTPFDVGVALEVGTGAIFEGMPEPADHFALPVELPDSVNLATELPPPQNQGKRNTCVAFTLVAMYQHASGDTTDLSEQFLYWACKERDGIPHVRGTRPDVALAALRDLGVCAEPTWPYNPEPEQGDEGQGPPPDGAPEEARHRRITGFANFHPKNVRQIQAALAAGKLVLIGLPTSEHWTGSWQSRALGRVRRPLPGEADLGGHAVCAVGYRNDPEAPGGGYFIIRNSWGTSWGTDNPDGAGYGHVPYALVHETNLAAFTIEGVVSDVGPTSDDETLSSDAQDAGPAPDLVSLYDEARDIQQRLNTLVERLAALAGRHRSG